MLNHDLATPLSWRIGLRVLLYCILNALLLTPVVLYIAVDAGWMETVIGFAALVMGFAVPMALFNGVLTRYWLRRLPDHVPLTTNPEPLRRKLFLSNYLGLPLLYLALGIVTIMVLPSGLLWWSIAAAGAWLFSGFIAVSAVDREVWWLSLYGSPRKQKLDTHLPERLVASDTVSQGSSIEAVKAERDRPQQEQAMTYPE